MMTFYDILYCYEWWEDNPEKYGRLTGLKGKVLRGLTSELINTFVVEYDGITQQQVKINPVQKGSRAGIQLISMEHGMNWFHGKCLSPGKQ